MSAPSGPPPSLLAQCRALASGHGSPLSVRAYTLAYTLLVAALFGAAVSGLHLALQERTARVSRLARESVLLELFGLSDPARPLSAEATHRLYEEKIAEVAVSSQENGEPYRCFHRRDIESPRVVIPLGGRGFWGPIHGLLALDTDTETFAAIAFTAHEETPGLGGRISDPDVRARFAGKRYAVADEQGRRLRVVPSAAPGSTNEVDAITGATATSDAVEQIVNDGLAAYLAATERAKKESP